MRAATNAGNAQCRPRARRAKKIVCAAQKKAAIKIHRKNAGLQCATFAGRSQTKYPRGYARRKKICAASIAKIKFQRPNARIGENENTPQKKGKAQTASAGRLEIILKQSLLQLRTRSNIAIWQVEIVRRARVAKRETPLPKTCDAQSALSKDSQIMANAPLQTNAV